MRVLVVTPTLPSPAHPRAQPFIAEQIRGLEAAGAEPDVLILDRSERGPLVYSIAVPLIRARIRASQPDLIHFMYGGMMAGVGILATKRLPTVVSFCGVDLLGANYGPLAYRARTAIGVRFSRFAALRADGIVVKSQNLRNGLPPGIGHSRVWIVPNGVDLDRFRPLDRKECRVQLGWEDGIFHVLFSTPDRRNWKKRLPLAEAAVAILDGRGAPSRLQCLSNVPHEQVPVWLNAADVMLLTSRSDEGSPNLVKEALACNVPVVSTDVGDVRERLEGIAGCHVAADTPEAIARALERVREGPRRVEGRPRMEELSLERVARRLIGIYEEVIRSFAS